jgi:hypothetical protein
MPSLLVSRLTVRSSYVRDVELPAGDLFDTIQYYVPDNGPSVFRVRTFAVDHDIHVHRFGSAGWTIAGLRAHIRGRVDLVPLPHLDTRDLVAAGIRTGALEVAADLGFAFWNPDGGRYRTRAEPIGRHERDGLREVVHLGGLVRFWLPDSWRIEEDCFYDPAGDSTLRLNVLTFDTPAVPVRTRPGTPGERVIDGGTLPNDCAFDVYEKDDGEALRTRIWQIAQTLPGQCRLFVFSYTSPAAAAPALAGELAMLDRELRRMIPHPEPT